MLSSKSKYALRALLLLTSEWERGPILVSELAVRERIPRKFLEAILVQLKRRGILRSRKGRGGGYALGRSPAQITIGEIVRVLDGPLAPVPCVSKTAYVQCRDCPDEDACGIRIVMQRVRDATADILDGTTLADVSSEGLAARRAPSNRGCP